MLINIVLGLAGAYLLVLVLMYWMQPRLLFLPAAMHPDALTPRSRGLEYQDVTLQTVDGERLHGWYLSVPGARSAAVFFHGNAGTIADRLDTAELITGLGLSVLLIDYRGYGRSSGRPSELGTYRDAQSAWRYLVESAGWKPGEIVIWGRSLGGAVATWLAARQPARGLIIESSFTSVPDLAAQLYPWLPVRWLSRFDYDSRRRLAAVRQPVLIVHSVEDEIIPFAHAQALYRAANPPRSLVPIRGPHNGGFLLDRVAYLAALRDFLSVTEGADGG